MDTIMIPSTDETVYTRALEVLRLGGLVAFPTDTVYGLGALAFDGAAVDRLYAAKDRPAEKAIPVLLGDAEDLGKIAVRVPPMAMDLAVRFWPGALTLVVPQHPALPAAISENETVGVRVPDHPVARALLRVTGPLAVTSANRSGLPAPALAVEALTQLEGRIALVIDGGKTPGGIPSTVVDCTGTEPKVLRKGPISAEQVAAALGQKTG